MNRVNAAAAVLSFFIDGALFMAVSMIIGISAFPDAFEGLGGLEQLVLLIGRNYTVYFVPSVILTLLTIPIYFLTYYLSLKYFIGEIAGN